MLAKKNRLFFYLLLTFDYLFPHFVKYVPVSPWGKDLVICNTGILCLLQTPAPHICKLNYVK